MSTRVIRLILIGIATTAAAACFGGGSDGASGGEPDGDVDAIGPDGHVDRGTSGTATQITITGTVFAEGAPARGEGGVFDPPLGAPVSSGGHVQGATVYTLDVNGDVIAEAETNDSGNYSVRAPSRDPMFLYVEYVEGYAGSVRFEQQRMEADYEAYDIVLASFDGLAEVAAMSGTTYDGNRGTIAVGVNAVDETSGGEGAQLSATHDPAFNLLPDGVFMGNRLAPVCGGSSSPDCVPARTKQIFFPNVAPGRTSVTPLSPSGGSCALRFDVPTWRVEPHTLTVVNVDCSR